MVKKLNFDGLNTKEIFSIIYEENYWGSDQSISGTGSELIQTNNLKSKLEKAFKIYQFKSILDAPCGDFNWMKQVNLNGIQYTGLDIVDKLIQSNKSQYGDLDNVKFRVGNIFEDQLPNADLILCRDCLVHFSFADIAKAVENIKKSSSKYLLTTSFINFQSNQDIQTGYWRPINLQMEPFNFPDPILIIDEKCTEVEGKYKDKSLLLWEIKNIS
ncbi:MAG: class I SAM-dependent methyltransferase [Cyclobacteriaceae bacterium]